MNSIQQLLNWLECETFLVMDECVELQGTFEWNCLLLPLQVALDSSAPLYLLLMPVCLMGNRF